MTYRAQTDGGYKPINLGKDICTRAEGGVNGRIWYAVVVLSS